MKKIFALVASVSLIASTSFAAASGIAEITSVSGKVLVNKGDGFQPVSGFVSLNAGDAVMVGEESVAAISYATGCTVTASPASVVTITEVAPCAAGNVVGTAGAVFVQPTADYSPAAAGVSLLPLLLIGGAVVGGGILIASGALSDDGGGVSGAP